MLTCHITQGPDLKSQVIQPFLDKNYRFIVSDLETKFWMQSVLRQKRSIICGDQVLRASELWQSFLLKLDPEWQVLPSSIAQFLIEKWMIEILKDHQLNLSNKDCRKAYQTIGQILPLLSHFEGADAIADWFEESEGAKERWYDWYQLGSFLWQRFQDKKLIPMECMKAVLLNDSIDHVSEGPLFFDLGIDIDDVESELILNLSRITDVDVIIPESEIDNESYAGLISRCQPVNYERDQAQVKKTYKKFPSMLSEVKEAVATVRSWLDQGTRAHKIAIVSPAIENYWPTLSEYLEVEGIPADKNRVTPLSHFEVYQSWLSKMRLSLSQLESFDSQQILYTGGEEPLVDYNEFVSLFENIYDIGDFKRSDLVKSQIPKPINPEELTSFENFLKWAFHLMATKDWPHLIRLLPDFDDVIVVKETLTFEKWVEFFESYFSRTEKKIKSGELGGIAILSPSAALNQPFDKLFVMGLSENNITERQQTALHWSDIESIKLQFGFNLPHADRFKLLDKLYWMDLKNCNEIYLTLSETDFSGQFQAPSLYWLKGAIASDHSMSLDSPQPTRWDQLMSGAPQQDWTGTSRDPDQLSQFLKRDKGEVSFKPAAFKELSLSASSLEEYFKCPFRFFAQKGLKLGNLPSLDLDLDYMTRGRLIHKICELLLKENQLSINVEKINSLIEKAKEAIDMPIYNGEIWNFLKPLYVELTKSFIKFEREWRENYPSTQVFGVEKFLKTHISITEEGFKFSDKGSIPFRGMIDRIDKNEKGQYAIIDYKTSGGGLTQFGSWLKNGKLQLALYSLALIEGAMDGESKDVVGAFYYVMRGIDRSKGFVISEADSQFLPSKKMERTDLVDLLAETKKLIGLMIQDILAGRVEPKPSDDKICDTCDWNKVCRYPQLNH